MCMPYILGRLGIRRINFECKQGYKKRNLEGLYSIHRLDGEQAD